MKKEKKYIDVDQLFRCDTCHHHRSGKCDTWCENGESYRPDVSIIKTADVAPVVRGEWLPTTKHKWKTDENGEIEEWAWEYEFHNGPTCVICHAHPCVHCNPAWEEGENCYEHFVCSVCGRHEEEKHPYCHCGAKMDGGKHEKV